MALMQILLLLLYATVLICCLPITSTPLESNPDHLAWDALLAVDTKDPDQEEVRKIPKSIFITPNLNESKVTCRPGYKLGSDGKCYKTSNFNIDPLDILKTQIESLLNVNHNKTTSSIEDEEYDYDSYDTNDANSAFNVPLSLSFADEQQPIKLPIATADHTLPETVQILPFRAEGPDNFQIGINVNDKPDNKFDQKSDYKSDNTTNNHKSSTEHSKHHKTSHHSDDKSDHHSDHDSTSTSTQSTYKTHHKPSHNNKHHSSLKPKEHHTENKKNQTIEEKFDNSSELSNSNRYRERINDTTTQSTTANDVSSFGKNPNGSTNISTKNDSKKPISIDVIENEQANTITTEPNVALNDEDQQLVLSLFDSSGNNAPESYEIDIVPTTTDQIPIINTNYANKNNSNQNDHGLLLPEDLMHLNHGKDEENKRFDKPKDEKDFATVLQSELLFKDDSIGSGASLGNDSDIQTTIADGTTEINDAIDTITTTELPMQNEQLNTETNNLMKEDDIMIKRVLNSTVPKMNVDFNVTPATKYETQVQIVTPVHSDLAVDNDQLNKTKTTNGKKNEPTDMLSVENDSDIIKKLRESVTKHEQNLDAIETIDQHNRFIYNHLDLSSLKHIPSEPTKNPLHTTTQKSFLEQLKMISRLSQDNRKYDQHSKIRFPDRSSPISTSSTETKLFPNSKENKIKFPGPVHQRTVPNRNRLIPDQIPKKPPEGHPSYQRQPPQPPRGWTVDHNQTNMRPVLMRFWNKMPLIRDPSFHEPVSERSRENSKSPRESLFQEVPVSDVYKVLSSKSYRHSNR